MKRILFYLFIQISVIFSLMADDGVCNDVESWSYGHIYTNAPSDKIALEKELMLCNQDSITAIFVFKNTTDDTVTVDCAFPINVNFIYTVNKEINKENYLWASRSESTLRLLLGPKDTFDCDEIKSDDGYINFNDRVYQLALKHDKELRVMSGEKYSKYIDSLNFSLDDYVPNCNIEQDGTPVDILNVGIESSVKSSDATIYMNFHFHHNLTFLPNSYSKVVAKYSIESFGCNQFGCSYDISTGGTWKGNIKSFMAFVFDGEMSSELNYFSLENWDNWGTGVKRYGVGYKKDYKPHKGEKFHFDFGMSEWEAHGQLSLPEYKELQSVKLKDIKASASWNNLKAMMDKDRFTSCAITDWQYATLEFTLPQDAYGPYMYNGTIGKLTTKEKFDEFRDSLNAGFWSEDINISKFFPKDSTIDAYNNVKTISIEQLDEPNDTLSFDVSASDPRDYPYVFDWERFNDIKHMRYFPAGRYRMSIKDIFKGWQCQDTTLITEFCFLKIPKDIADMLADDAISEMPIFDGFPMMLDPSLIPVPVDSSAFKVDTVAVALLDTVPSKVITATPKVVIMNREIPLSVLIGALIFTVLIVLGCVYWQKKNKI